MRKSQLEYSLPKKLIATEPADPRDSSRLLVLDKHTGRVIHKKFYELSYLIQKGDVLVFNNTRVINAKIIGKKETGGVVEVLVLKEMFSNNKKTIWQCLVKNLKSSQKIFFDEKITAHVITKKEKIVMLEFNLSRVKFNEFLEQYGQTPLPPYIEKMRVSQIDSKAHQKLKTDYQTIYAKSGNSVAAPTAGLHFTDSLFDSLKKSGIECAFVNLTVGMGTFEPIQHEDLTQHTMHTESFSLSKDVAQYLNKKKAQGSRIVAVGTTTVRVLESCADEAGLLHPRDGDTDIFIYPPYRFKAVDALITNFHLPGSTLLSLVSAFVSYPNTNTHFTSFSESVVGHAYKIAIDNLYRFYSFGDAMLIE